MHVVGGGTLDQLLERILGGLRGGGARSDQTALCYGTCHRRREIFARLREAAEAHGIRLDVCACKNSDIVRGSPRASACNIAGTWPARTPRAAQAQLPCLVYAASFLHQLLVRAPVAVGCGVCQYTAFKF